MVPRFNRGSGCSHCRYIESFAGADWYICLGTNPPALIRQHGDGAHSFEQRSLVTRPSGGPWLRALLLAEKLGLTKA